MEKREIFKCECIECGHKLESEEHCKDLKCPECGGQMRREERPGPGEASRTRELRDLKFEVRMEETEGQANNVIGHGVVYDRRSEDLGGFVEIVRKGAFDKALESGDEIKSFYNHDPSMVLATTSSEPPLKIRNNKANLSYEAEIPNTSYGKDLAENLRRKNVTGSSFAFTVTDDDWFKEKDGTVVREIKEAKLFELGPVTNPAYLPTTAAVRSLKNQKEEFDSSLRAQEEKKEQDEESKRARARRLREIELS
jgi:uncharacterized protein